MSGGLSESFSQQLRTMESTHTPSHTTPQPPTQFVANMTALLESGNGADGFLVLDSTSPLPLRAQPDDNADADPDAELPPPPTDDSMHADPNADLPPPPLPSNADDSSTPPPESESGDSSGIRIAVHTCIVGAHSPVLASALEAGQGSAEVCGYDERAVRAALHYMYTGQVEEIGAEWVVDLLEFAGVYGLPLLSELALLWVQDGVDAENAASVWAAAHRFGNGDVVEKVAAFVLDPENGEHVLGSGAFVALPFDVVELLMSDTALPVPELAVFDAASRWLGANIPEYPATAEEDDIAHASRILAAVRYPLMTPEEVADIVEPTELVPDWLLKEVYRYHATGRVPDQEDADEPTKLRFTPRAISVTSVRAASFSSAPSPSRSFGPGSPFQSSGYPPLY